MIGIRIRQPPAVLVAFAALVVLALACNAPSMATPTPIAQGPTPTAQPTITPRPTEAGGSASSCRYSAELVSTSLPHGARVNPGESFSQEWRLENTGSCDWQAAQLQFAGGQPFGTASESFAVPAAEPGETVSVPVQLKAPQNEGNHRADWQLVNREGRAFGPRTLTVVTQVASSGQPPSGSGTGAHNQTPSLLGVVNQIVGTLAPPAIQPGLTLSPKEIALMAIDPSLAEALELAEAPRLDSVDVVPDEQFYIEPLTAQTLSGSLGGDDSDEEEPQIGTPPEPPEDRQSQPPDRTLGFRFNGQLQVSEYRIVASRNLSSKPIPPTQLVLDRANRTARFYIQHCESGANNKGIASEVSILAQLNDDGAVELTILQTVHRQNCRTGGAVFTVPARFNDYAQETEQLVLDPGDSTSLDQPWLNYRLAGSGKYTLTLSVAEVEHPVRDGDYVTRRQR